jgi:uncharacterized protein (TIGR00369 family)
MPNELMDTEVLRGFLNVSPFQTWLGLTLEDVREDGVDIAMPFREELLSNPTARTVHGGILATLVDLTGLYSVLATTTPVMATVDLRVDYHRPALPGPLLAKGTIIKLGRKLSSAETRIFSGDKLVASGRGVYLGAGS